MSLLAACVLAAPSVPVLAAVFDPDVPMVARATAPARRAASAVTVGTTVPPSEVQLLAAEVVRLANLERAAAGRSTLGIHPAVLAAAMAHSEDMAARGQMSHTGSDGSDAGTRLTRAGFTWQTWGENIAAGQRTAQEVVTAWMNSSGHRAIILGSAFTTIGVGVAIAPDGTRYWTMVLAA
jgi:uncharacterized protein YkwD